MAHESLFKKLLASWGPDARIEGTLGSGHRHTSKMIRVAGEKYVARLSNRPAVDLEWELQLLQHLHQGGMRVPFPLPAQDGRLTIEGLVVYRWLDGHPPDSEAAWRSVATELERLHRLTQGWPQRPGFCPAYQLVNHDTCGDIDMTLLPRRVAQLCRTAWQPLTGESLSIIHGDPHPNNVCISPEGIGLIDWTEARVDASILDLATLPIDLSDRLSRTRVARARRAMTAWEVANSWIPEPGYARSRLGDLGKV